jgi:hypothetical protein
MLPSKVDKATMIDHCTTKFQLRTPYKAYLYYSSGIAVIVLTPTAKRVIRLRINNPNEIIRY